MSNEELFSEIENFGGLPQGDSKLMMKFYLKLVNSKGENLNCPGDFKWFKPVESYKVTYIAI